MKSQFVTLAEISQALAGTGNPPLSKQAISQFVADGMPKAQRGTYDLMACIGWYLNRLRAAVKRNEKEGSDGRTTNLEDERKRLIGAQADITEMEAGKLRGELIPIGMYENDLTTTAVFIRTNLQSLPGRTAPRLGMVERVKAKLILEKAVRDVLRHLATRGVEGQKALEDVCDGCYEILAAAGWQIDCKRPRARKASRRCSKDTPRR